MATPTAQSAQDIGEFVIGGLGIAGLALSGGLLFEAFGVFAGGLALYFLRESVPWRQRVFYAFASMAIGVVFAPGLADLASSVFPQFPQSLRPAIGFLAVTVAVPFVTVWRAGWRRLADHPEQIWNWLEGFIPPRFRSGGRDDQ